MTNMPSSEFNRYLAAIKAANDSEDKEALRQIQKQLLSKYGPNDDNVYDLLRKFRYNL